MLTIKLYDKFFFLGNIDLQSTNKVGKKKKNFFLNKLVHTQKFIYHTLITTLPYAISLTNSISSIVYMFDMIIK